VIRGTDDESLSSLTNKPKWVKTVSGNDIKEWSNRTIENLIRNNGYFRKGIINLFFEGPTISFLSQTLPLFEIKKLGISKLKFEITAMIDTLVRYKEKGSYSGKMENNPVKDRKYLNWCKMWILELVRVTKSTGLIFLHNIPKWMLLILNIG
jgi:hypothetical protein